VIGVLASGAGSNLQALIDAGLPVTAVASNRVGARALERGRAHGIAAAPFPLEEFESRAERDRAMAGWLRSRGVRLVALAGYLQLLTGDFLEQFPGRVVNVHPSLLPAFPGLHAVEQALSAGVAETGATVHLVDAGIDTGPVLVQRPVQILPDDTPERLHERIKSVEHRLLPEVVRELIVG